MRGVLFVKFSNMTVSSPQARALAGELSVSAVRLARRLRGRHADPNITLSQLSALSTLVREGAMTPGALAGREGVQPPSMTRVIASLSARNLVDRRPHPTDGRQIIVAASASGLALIADEAKASEVWLTQWLAKLSAEELALLGQAVGIMGQLVERPIPRAG